MSLAWRILLVVLLLNLVVVGSLQTVLLAVHREWIRQEQSENLDASLVTNLLRVYTAERLADTTEIRALLSSPVIRDYFDDVVVTSGRPPFSGIVFLNPRGAVGRDPDRFSIQEIYAGMDRARNAEGLVRVGEGYCFAVWLDDQVAGYFWFVPKPGLLRESTWPLWISVAFVLFGTVLFGALLYWIVVRALSRPLQHVGQAAVEVGRGAYAVRLPELRSIPELDALVRSFNTMAAKVQGHTDDLEQAVREAVARTEERQQALVLSSRLAAIGTLAAGIAHEINNPIGGMQNAVNRLLKVEGLSQRQHDYLLLVSDGLSRIARTARRVLDFSPRSVEAAPFAIGEAIDGARALVEHRLRENQIVFERSVEEGLPEVFGDAHEIQQVLLNLFLNSVDALESQPGGGRLQVDATLEDDKVCVVVQDDGPGMSPEDLGRVMDPFFTRKDRPDASGLGMFISYSIVQNHGGDMQVTSEPGRGFRVVIRLPRVAG
ncbi:MAG: HAMP domain-containing sensor histidine kinase [Planctomycetota bacterium]|nr:HAMP domain-containing sensor histidine kinase [Planctomycetota bacterium]